jgi:guanine deaminase
MDCNSPDFYCETTEKAIDGTRRFAAAVDEIDNGAGLVKSIVTPRFAITCSRELMKELGNISRELNLPIQSHLSENKGECNFVASLFPECPDYASVYDSVGLLTPATIMAHSIYLSETEIALLKERGTSISHCPNSNFSLSSGIMPLRKYLEKGLKIGLGTDVSGGYSLSILDAMRQAIIASKCIAFQDPSQKELSVKEAFYVATLGGAEALNLNHRVGNFVPGKCFDALFVKSPVLAQHLSLEHRLEHFVFTGSKSDIASVYVKGRLVVQ